MMTDTDAGRADDVAKDEKMMTMDEAMVFLKISRRQMKRYLKGEDDRGNPLPPIPRHQLPGTGQRIRFLPSELLAWTRRKAG